MGIGAMDTTSELSLHMLGMHGTAYANYAVEDCDFLFAVGSRFDDRVAGKVKEFAPGAKIAHLDVDASEIGKVKNGDWAHVSDAKVGLQQLLKAGAGFKKSYARWRTHVQELRRRHPLDYNRESTAIQPEYVLEQLNQITRGQAIVTTGVGQHQMWAAQYLDFVNARTFLTSGSMGTMGFGLPAPAFLEVMIDQTAHVYPMVAPGMGYKDMITGKWIKSREQKPPSDEEPSGYF